MSIALATRKPSKRSQRAMPIAGYIAWTRNTVGVVFLQAGPSRMQGIGCTFTPIPLKTPPYSIFSEHRKVHRELPLIGGTGIEQLYQQKVSIRPPTQTRVSLFSFPNRGAKALQGRGRLMPKRKFSLRILTMIFSTPDSTLCSEFCPLPSRLHLCRISNCLLVCSFARGKFGCSVGGIRCLT